MEVWKSVVECSTRAHLVEDLFNGDRRTSVIRTETFLSCLQTDIDVL